MMSASILMTVAIAVERYIAVHHPLDYNQVPVQPALSWVVWSSFASVGKYFL
jgi:hypothetical protein